jgi:hypothetical protein
LRLAVLAVSPILFWALRFFRQEEWAALLRLIKRA